MMTDFESLERELITKARSAIEPSAADQCRLRAQLAERMALLALAPPAAGVPVSHPLRHLWQSHLVALGTVATGAALVAFGAGYATGRRAPVVKTIVVGAPSHQELADHSQPSAPQPEPKPAFLPSLSGLGHSGTRTKMTAPSAPSAEAPDNPLAEELDLLKRSERMIRSNNPMVAIGLLSELDHKYPKGQLLEERTAARAMANCQLVDEDSARLQGQAYLSAHARSVYAARVRAICHLDSASTAKESPGTGD
jgi:hypothetical protein